MSINYNQDYCIARTKHDTPFISSVLSLVLVKNGIVIIIVPTFVLIQWFEVRNVERNPIFSGVATGRGSQGKHSAKNLPKIGKKREKIRKNGKKSENIGKKRKIGKFLSLCPSWQIRLATLLPISPRKYTLKFKCMSPKLPWQIVPFLYYIHIICKLIRNLIYFWFLSVLIKNRTKKVCWSPTWSHKFFICSGILLCSQFRLTFCQW